MSVAAMSIDVNWNQCHQPEKVSIACQSERLQYHSLGNVSGCHDM